jgi:hypothetical protein
LVAVVGQHFHTWKELLEFHFPVEDHRGRYHNEMRSPDTLVTREMCK